MEASELRTIVLARHGQTNFNLNERIQDPINPYLTETGHLQAKNLGKEIEKLGLNFDIIICSDTTRNKETLANIYPNYEKMANIKVDPRLQERYHGDLIGKTKQDVEKEIGQKFTDRLSWELYFEGTNKSRLTEKNYIHDESLDSIKKRVTSLIFELRDKNKILLIGSAIINHYILELLQYGTIGVNKPQFPKGKDIHFQDNNELRIISLDGDMKMKEYSSIKY
ncbi:MAG: 2,3-bisphosphoglycerate-dependent phosphoglycerate mutase [Candidatus Levybacteria bacterium GW2011_GWB1_37_8]|nr:MAG: 2,3-bisphosphoglycerate-dependent phosphoglycerate mutase [Candidatus Levybacteria bacterium GW2011_GWC2_37_7]KKQ41073.1 MAG: 2,3-bisphosphoglycerate-dependent phosphoglycerate mutase [Candidatus Levybacteria bacterium GW2011_GWB1_37_8]